MTTVEGEIASLKKRLSTLDYGTDEFFDLQNTIKRLRAKWHLKSTDKDRVLSAFSTLDRVDQYRWMAGELSGFPKIPEKRYWEFLRDWLTMRVNPGEWASEITYLVSFGGPYGYSRTNLLMTPDERRAKANLAFPLTIYRGEVEGERDSLRYSWTTDRKVAEGFAWRKDFIGKPKLLRAAINENVDFAFFLSREESEVFVFEGMGVFEEVPMESTDRFELSELIGSNFI